MWKIPAAPSAASRTERASVTLPSTVRTRPEASAPTRFTSRIRLSKTFTEAAPSAIRWSTTCDPMNPEPPVTRKTLPEISMSYLSFAFVRVL